MNELRMAVRASISRWALAGLVVAAGAGCGDRSDLNLAQVQGRVTYNGEPVDHGQVVFIPGPGVEGPSAVGEINPDGTFRMKTASHDGAAVGSHKVTVHSRRPLRPEEAKSLIIPELLIPERYASEEETPISVDVEAGGTTLDIELTD